MTERQTDWGLKVLREQKNATVQHIRILKLILSFGIKSQFHKSLPWINIANTH